MERDIFILYHLVVYPKMSLQLFLLNKEYFTSLRNPSPERDAGLLLETVPPINVEVKLFALVPAVTCVSPLIDRRQRSAAPHVHLQLPQNPGIKLIVPLSTHQRKRILDPETTMLQ